jgi:hypothetical protein
LEIIAALEIAVIRKNADVDYRIVDRTVAALLAIKVGIGLARVSGGGHIGFGEQIGIGGDITW